MEKPIGYQIKVLSKAFKRTVDKKANEQGINGTYMFILKALADNENGLKQNEICDYAKLRAPTISLTLNNMELEGLIERCKSEEDNRATIVKLSKKGIEMDLKLRSIFEETENKMVSSLNENEKEIFESCINKMINELEGD